MKRILLALLAAILVLGLFAAIGYTGYRFGYAQGVQGMQTTTDGDTVRPFNDFGARRMPLHNFGFGRGLGRGFDGFPMWRFGFFPIVILLGRIAVLALIIWFVYWLFTWSGWRLSRQAAEKTSPKTENEQVM